MKDYIPTIAAVIVGVFTIISAFIAWRLKNASEEQAKRLSLEKERREEVRALYATTFILFEKAICGALKGGGIPGTVYLFQELIRKVKRGRRE